MLIFHILRCTDHSRPHNIQLRKYEPDKQTICISVSESNIEYSVRYTLREYWQRRYPKIMVAGINPFRFLCLDYLRHCSRHDFRLLCVAFADHHKRLRAFENLSAMVWITLCMIFYGFGTQRIKETSLAVQKRFVWRTRWDSNPWPTESESVTLSSWATGTRLIRFIVAHWSKMSNTLKLIYQADRVDDESRFSFFKQINPI